jgi:hypothetical protein
VSFGQPRSEPFGTMNLDSPGAGRTLRIFSDRGHYSPAFRPMLADVLRPFWKECEVSTDERRRMYGAQVDRYQVVDSPADADLCVLPLAWNHYYRHGILKMAHEFISRARAHGTPVATWVTGDSGVRVPDRGVYVFRQSGYAARRLPNQHALPVFIRDPAPAGVSTALIRIQGSRPVVGFCGQAADDLPRQGVKSLRTAFRNAAFAAGFTEVEPESLYPPTRFRAHALRLLERSNLVETRFIARRSYGGDARTAVELSRNRAEFWANIRDTDYTVCIRGSGNFSQRLYEVLAMGRIPIFVNTDCILPADHLIEWNRYCVWVEAGELEQLPARVAEHHASFDAQGFEELQLACRALWKEHLSYPGFFTHFPSHFRQFADSPGSSV